MNKHVYSCIVVIATPESNTKVHQCRIETDYEMVPSAAMKMDDTDTLNSMGEFY